MPALEEEEKRAGRESGHGCEAEGDSWVRQGGNFRAAAPSADSVLGGDEIIKVVLALPRRSSGYDSELPLQGARI